MKLNTSNTSIIRRLLVGRNNRPLRSILGKIDVSDLAALITTLSRREVKLLVEALISIERAAPVLSSLPEPQLNEVLSALEQLQIFNIISQSRTDEGAYIMANFSTDEQNLHLDRLDPVKARRIRQFLSYPQDSVGRIMQGSPLSLSMELNCQQALDTLREKAQVESIYYIYCVNDRNQLAGIISLRQLATAPLNKPLKELVKQDVVFVYPEEPEQRAAELVSHYDIIAIPVVDRDRHLLGIVTVDDIVDVIQDQVTANMYAQVGLQKDDRVVTPTMAKIQKRLPWMFLNLMLAGLASSVVSLFESTMSQLIVLASLNNIVASMSGNFAIQSLTVVTRALATGDFKFVSPLKAVLKEVGASLTMGLITGAAAGVLIYFWKNNLLVAVVIGLALAINSLVAAVAGALVPLTLRKLGSDPATGSGVLVTITTDIFSFFSFLGIAALGLKYFT